jgi:hypothetical protein
MANSKIVIDADNGKVDAAADKTAQKMRGITKEAATAGKQLEQWARPLTGALAKITAMAGVISAIGREIDRQKAQAIDVNKSAGGARLEREKNVISLGLDRGPAGMNGAMSLVENAGGGKTQQETDDLLAAITQAQKDSRRQFGAGNITKGLGLFQSGVVTQDEIVEGLKTFNGINLLGGRVPDRQARLSPTAKKEMFLRDQERETQNIETEAYMDSGYQKRVTELSKRQQDAKNGGVVTGLRNMVEGGLGAVPIIGGGLSAGFNLTNDAIIGSNRTSEGMIKSLQNIEKSNNEMRVNSRPRPIGNTSPEGGQ